MIITQLEMLQSFVNDLLDLRQLKYQEFRPVYERFEVLSVVRQACNVFLPQLLMKTILFDVIVQGVPIVKNSV